MCSHNHGQWVQNPLDLGKPSDDSGPGSVDVNPSSLLRVITAEHLLKVYEEYTVTAHRIAQTLGVRYVPFSLCVEDS